MAQVQDGIRKVIPQDIIDTSIFFALASAYLHVIREFEKTSGYSQTRLLVLFLFRNKAVYNQNQLAVALGADRSVVHRVLKTMIKDGLVSEKKQVGKRQILLQLTNKGEQVRADLIEKRKSLDQKLKKTLSKKQSQDLIEALTDLVLKSSKKTT